MSKGVVLVADDDAAIRTVINQALKRAGFEVRVTSNFATLLDWVKAGEGEVVVSDVIMPDGNAFEVLPDIKHTRPEVPVILISAQNTFMTALKAQEVGAFEYLPKPFDLDELVKTVERGIFEPKDIRTNQSVEDYSQGMPLVGRSTKMQEIYRSIARLVHTELPVLVTGDPGTGKRLIANVLHDFGERKHRPFVPVNLTAIPPDLIEGELFGRIDSKGEPYQGLLRQADYGTLYLDEIGELPLTAQSRLLRVLLQSEVTPVDSTTTTKIDIRLIVSSSKDIQSLINDGSFREDLFYRLNVLPMHLPPLQSRMDDIPDLARHFIKLTELEGSPARHLEPEAISALKEYPWPGNVRELENLIRRICILYPQESITSTMVETEIRNSGFFNQHIEEAKTSGFNGIRGATEFFVNRYYEQFEPGLPDEGVYHRFLEEFEYPLIKATLMATNGNQVKAARLLGLNRNTLRKKLNQHGIRISKMTH